MNWTSAITARVLIVIAGVVLITVIGAVTYLVALIDLVVRIGLAVPA